MHRHRQVHLWITEHDYAELAVLARRRGETLSAIIRRLIKRHHASRRLSKARRIRGGLSRPSELPSRLVVRERSPA